MDIYKVWASKHFGVPYSEVTEAQRDFAKVRLFGPLYSMSVKEFLNVR